MTLQVKGGEGDAHTEKNVTTAMIPIYFVMLLRTFAQQQLLRRPSQ